MTSFMLTWRLYWLLESASITRKINGLFFYLRKIPVIGKMISVTIYRNYDIKKTLFILGTILEVLSKIVKKFLWVSLYIGIMQFTKSMSLIDTEVSVVESGLILWLFAVPLFWGANAGLYQHLRQQDADFIANFQVSNRLYIQSQMLAETIHDALSYLPVLFLLGWFSEKPLSVPIVGTLSYLGSFFLFYYSGRIISPVPDFTRKLLNWGCYALIFGLISIIFWQNSFMQLFGLFFSSPGIIVSFLLFLGGSWLLFTYKHEENYTYWLIEHSTNRLESKTTVNKNTNTYLGEGLKMQKDLKLVHGEATHLTGNQYLNSLLFSRYRPTLTRLLKWRLLGIAVVGVSAAIIGYFSHLSQVPEKQIIAKMPVLFFVMYLLTFGKKVVQMVFINCDSSMLFYPFYREPKTILQGFYYRFWKTFFYNGLVSLAIFIMSIVINIGNRFFLSLSFFGILGFLLVSLSFLFSFHELFIYYLLQPFSSDLEVVNPLYKAVAGSLYLVSYMNLQLQSTGATYVVIVSTLSLVYVAIGLIIVWRLAPRTFRFKG